MASCELCGRETDSINKTKIEGATLKVCDSCSDMGEEVKTKTTKKKKQKKRGGNKNPRTDKVLVDDYGKRIKQAREAEEISIKELSQELNEKSSLISKLEKQELKPDNSLAQKISDRLDIELYTNPQVSNYETESGDSRKATVEDVAEVNNS